LQLSRKARQRAKIRKEFLESPLGADRADPGPFFAFLAISA
jgi:hypothetical protein